VNAVKMFLDGVVQDDAAIMSLKHCIRKSNYRREVGNQNHKSHQTSTEKYSNTHEKKMSVINISPNENILQPSRTSNDPNIPIKMDLKQSVVCREKPHTS
jgi:selenocysteine lyase/cysteine desulfurase